MIVRDPSCTCIFVHELLQVVVEKLEDQKELAVTVEYFR